MTDRDTMTGEDRREMMRAMMEQFFAGMGSDEKKEMCTAMMGKMTEGLDMKEMMPRMMMGMMSGGAGAGGMPEMMPETTKGGPSGHMSQMPEMMLKKMMPHCISVMLPALGPEERAAAAAAILSALVETGTAGMSDAQKRDFTETLKAALTASD